MTDEIVQRINMEIEWIERQKLVRGFLQLMTIMEAAYSQLDMSIGPENGFLSGSVVAYCLGQTKTLLQRTKYLPNSVKNQK